MDVNSATVRPSGPKEHFQVTVSHSGYRSQYVVAGDGQRFLVNALVGETTPSQITVVVNWAARLKR